MVFVGNKKYACETCIKGHRSSTCKHTDRPLYEIKKKGRPATQCEHCRELRKTKQLHVKCMCASKIDNAPDAAGPSTMRKGPSLFVRFRCLEGAGERRVSQRAIPEALEMSVALSDGSDSELSHVPCECDHSGPCNCTTPRAPRNKGKTRARPLHGNAEQDPCLKSSREPPVAGPAGIVASAHAAGHRPVLPRPPPPEHPVALRTAHVPSATPSHLPGGRRTSHDQHYSPYGKAYEEVYTSDQYRGQSMTYQSTISPTNEPSDPTAALPDFQPWPAFSSPSPSASPFANISLCGCGPTCACLGCFEHRGRDVLPGATCANPNTCIACLECAMLAIPPEVPGMTYEDTQAQNVDEWLRQMTVAEPQMQPQSEAAMPTQPVLPSTPSSMLGMRRQTANPSFSPQPSGPVHRAEAVVPYDPTLLQTYALWNDLHDARTRSRPVQGEWDELAQAETGCCGGRCQCPPGLCSCPRECCGCCQGCACEGHLCQHGAGVGEGGRLTFAVSGERGGCCVPPSRATASSSVLGRRQGGTIAQPQPVTEAWMMQLEGANVPGTSGVVDWNAQAQTLTVSRVTPSRASSHSSQSSAGLSHSSTSSSLGSVLGMPSPLSASGSCCSSR
ncbi:uncharacterized protein B0H18DRAFT_911900 [Fomitopsis serialis]|uniref:uncharacterized protein n=1 Tax=Fomitopsis serialis TaxID=139415 RepID=UPI00200880A3|nr:uncharacterized protein B0H18DRAFT_911900 [Neoantrodia serialis]KAH9919897.1 hypothetical protein B0H18DRAFT_911900 [Neoantrodia serialis]